MSVGESWVRFSVRVGEFPMGEHGDYATSISNSLLQELRFVILFYGMIRVRHALCLGSTRFPRPSYAC